MATISKLAQYKDGEGRRSGGTVEGEGTNTAGVAGRIQDNVISPDKSHGRFDQKKVKKGEAKGES